MQTREVNVIESIAQVQTAGGFTLMRGDHVRVELLRDAEAQVVLPCSEGMTTVNILRIPRPVGKGKTQCYVVGGVSAISARHCENMQFGAR